MSMSSGLITVSWVLDLLLLLALGLLTLMLYAVHTLPQLMAALDDPEHPVALGAERDGTLDRTCLEEETPSAGEVVERSDQRGTP